MNGGELLILVVLALIVLGPERLPGYVAELKKWIRQGRDLVRATQAQLKSEADGAFGDVDWAAYDPRQYDPRRILREALEDDPEESVIAAAQKAQVFDPSRPTVFDTEAT